MMRSSKGFTKLELAVTLLVICVLIGIFLPRYIRYVRAGSDEICALNRATILRLYKAHQLTDPDCTLSDVLAGRCHEFEDDTSDYSCPSGGVFRVGGDGQLICSRHGG